MWLMRTIYLRLKEQVYLTRKPCKIAINGDGSSKAKALNSCEDTVCDTPSIQRNRLTWIATWLSNRKADVSRWQSRWITGSSPYKLKLEFRKYVNHSIINKNAKVNNFRKKVNFFFTFFSCYGTIKIRNGKDGLAQ